MSCHNGAAPNETKGVSLDFTSASDDVANVVSHFDIVHVYESGGDLCVTFVSIHE